MIGVVAVAVERLDKDARAGRSSVAGRLARTAIAAVAAAGWIVDRLSATRPLHNRLIAQREGSGK
jgi:hypothetical protein